MDSSVALEVSAVKADSPHTPPDFRRNTVIPTHATPSNGTVATPGPGCNWVVRFDFRRFRPENRPGISPAAVLLFMALEDLARGCPFATACNATLGILTGASESTVLRHLRELATAGWVQTVHQDKKGGDRLGIIFRRRAAEGMPCGDTPERLALIDQAVRGGWRPGSGEGSDFAHWSKILGTEQANGSSSLTGGGSQNWRGGVVKTGDQVKESSSRTKKKEKQTAGEVLQAGERNDGQSRFTRDLVACLKRNRAARATRAAERLTLDPGPTIAPTPDPEPTEAGSPEAAGEPGDQTRPEPSPDLDGFPDPILDRPEPREAAPALALPAQPPRLTASPTPTPHWCKLTHEQGRRFLALGPAEAAEAGSIRRTDLPTPEQLGRLSELLGGTFAGPAAPLGDGAAPVVAARCGPAESALGLLRDLTRHLGASRDASLAGRFGGLLATVLGRSEGQWSCAFAGIGRTVAVGALDGEWLLGVVDVALARPEPGRYLWGTLRTDARGHSARAAAEAALRSPGGRTPRRLVA